LKHASVRGESVVEDAALAWLESLGYTVKHVPEIAPGQLLATQKAVVAKNATVPFRSNVQNVHIASSGSWEGLFRF